ncbi:MAG: ATP-binding protein [Anaerolineales bacterium]
MTPSRKPSPSNPASPPAGAGRVSQWKDRIRGSLGSLRGQLIVPYVLLTLLTAMIGTFIITRLVASSARERFLNQLHQAGGVAADRTVRQEQTHLQALRLMTFSDGVPQAFQAHDVEALVRFLWPLALNGGTEAVIALDSNGVEIVSLVRKPGTNEYERTQGSDFAGVALVDRALAGDSDSFGDKFVDILDTSYGLFLYTSAPVLQGDQRVGVLLVGTRVESLVNEVKALSLADIVLLSPSGALLSTTMPAMGPATDLDILELTPGQIDSVSREPLTRRFRMYGRDYEAEYAPWKVRGDPEGILGVVLASSFIVTAEATSRFGFSALFALGTVAMIVLGYRLAQSIAGPILRLRSMAQAVASGDLEQQSGLRRPDEIGDLAVAFDVMTERLQTRTAEAERLYGEAVDRNRQLAEMYERLQQAQMQLIQSEKLAAVGQLTAGIVHDVKNPLAVIKGMAEELLEDSNGRPDVHEAVQVIRDNASRANSIVTDLLKFARQSTPELVRRDLRETVEGALRLTGYLLRKGKIRLEQKLPARPVNITYDAQQIEQVLINLIQNAVQAMPQGGALHIQLASRHGGAEVRLRDSGTGIPAEVLPRIFDPFFTTKAEGQGTGMGLSVSYGIVSRHGGRIDVESQMNKGTTFTILLPERPPEGVGEKEAVA